MDDMCDWWSWMSGCRQKMGLGGFMLYQSDENRVNANNKRGLDAFGAVSIRRKIELMPTRKWGLGGLMLYQSGEKMNWCQQKSPLRGAWCWHQRGNMPDWCQHWPRSAQSSTGKNEKMIQHGGRGTVQAGDPEERQRRPYVETVWDQAGSPAWTATWVKVSVAGGGKPTWLFCG